MWYLQVNKLLIIFFFSLIIGFLQQRKFKIPMKYLLPLAQAAILSFFDYRAGIFYCLYILFGFVLYTVLYKCNHNFLFFLFCLISLLPLIILRTLLINPVNPEGILFASVTVGIAFNSLKLMDILYHIYYSHEPVDFLTYVNYMLFLPVFTSGPIFRYRGFKSTFENPVSLDAKTFEDNIKRMIKGLFKKVVLLTWIMQIFHHFKAGGSHFYISFILAVLSYFILYLDLSGYSDIAIGFGKICGYDVPENFKKPWLAPTMTQFWRSWHSTLSDYIREHIFIVFSKKKLNKFKTSCIVVFTMLVMGLWHGFSIPFIIGGLYNGLLLAVENMTSKTFINRRKVSRLNLGIRCFFVNFLFALNTLTFTLAANEIVPVLKGFLKL